MSTPIETAIAHLRGEIEQRVDALRALERLAPSAAAPPVLTLTADKPPPTPLEAAIAAAPAPSTGRTVPRSGRTAPIPEAQLRELHGRGLNDAAIADALGRSQGGVSGALRKLNLAPNKARRPAASPTVERVNSAGTIVAWLRGRDTIITEAEPGKTWRVNGRDVIDRHGLLTMANRKREIAKLPPYAWEFGQ